MLWILLPKPEEVLNIKTALKSTWILPAFRAANMHWAVLKACLQLW